MVQVPLARQLNASACFMEVMKALPKNMSRIREDPPPPAGSPRDYAHWHTMERCNPCILGLAGWASGHFHARLWSAERGEYVRMAAAVPHGTNWDATEGVVVEKKPPFGPACEECGLGVVPPPDCSLTSEVEAMDGAQNEKHLPYFGFIPVEPELCFYASGGLEMVTDAYRDEKHRASRLQRLRIVPDGS